MIKDFLLSGFSTKKDEYLQYLTKISESINTILESIERIEETGLSEDAGEQKSLLQNLAWLIDRFPKNHFDDLKTSWYIRRNDLFEDIQKNILLALQSAENHIKNTKKFSKTSLLEEKEIFLNVYQKLDILTGKVRKFYFRIRLTTQLLFIVVLVMALYSSRRI